MNETWEFGGAASEESEPRDHRPADSPTRFPWPPTDDSVLGGFGETWKSASLEPGRFFAAMPRDSGTGPALLYYLVVGILVAGVALFWDMVTRLLMGPGGRAETEALAAELGLGTLEPVTQFLLSPLALLAGLAVTAGITHLLLLMFGGARHGFGTTVRVFCYAYSPLVLAVVPLLGALVGAIWMVILSITGLRAAHETAGWKAALAVLLPFILALTLVLLALAAVLATGAAILSS